MKRYFLFFLMILFSCSLVWGRHKTYVNLDGVNDIKREEAMQKNASDLLSEFNRAFFARSKLKLGGIPITQSAQETLNEIWAGKSFYCPEQRIFEIMISRSDGRYEIRNIPIMYNRRSSELLEDEVLIIFDSSNRIVDFKIALEKEKYIKTFEQAQTVQDKQLLEIVMDFVEDYRTAYNRKDISYIDKVFSDDALIIVGRVSREV